MLKFFLKEVKMELKEIKKNIYLKFALKNPYFSIYQLPEWGDLKKITGWEKYLLGFYEKEKLIGVTLLLEKKFLKNWSLFYAPRGFLMDVFNKNLVKEFTEKLKEFVKNKKGIFVKVDPNVIYETMNQDGKNKEIVGQKAHENFLKAGYKHLGFTKNFETIQPRYLCRFKLKDNYEDTLNSFTKSTRKNILKLDFLGVKTREIDIAEIDDFGEVLKTCAKDHNYIIRPTYYYKKMFELMKDYLKFYVTYVDIPLYKNNLKDEINKTKNKLVEIQKQMASYNIGTKLKVSLEQTQNKLVSLEKEYIQIKDIQEKKINIGALLSLFVGEEGITFLSATKKDYRKFNPKYSYYDQHIKDSIKLKKQYCNFYGISGDLNKKNPLYTIYEIKKGYNPLIIGLLGEYDLVINKFMYKIYKIGLKVYQIIKKLQVAKGKN